MGIASFSDLSVPPLADHTNYNDAIRPTATTSREDDEEEEEIVLVYVCEFVVAHRFTQDGRPGQRIAFDMMQEEELCNHSHNYAPKLVGTPG